MCFFLPLSARTARWFWSFRSLARAGPEQPLSGSGHSSCSGAAFSRSWMSSPLCSSTVVRLLNASRLCENSTSCSAHRSLVTVLSLLILCLAHGISHYEYIDWCGAGDAHGPLCRVLGLSSCVTAFSLTLWPADCRCRSLLEL